ncbi:MAG: hypothetical protein ACRERE_30730, partial [Candidatus Entotheonellia bacterium]
SEQRQTAETQWRQRQIRERLRSMAMDEMHHLFDALGLKAVWTRKQPLTITLVFAYPDEIAPL